MKNKVFSGINQLPRGKAENKYINGCLALEGGAFRGVYTSGVLDYLMEKGINFTVTVGVSAGALNGLNYVSGDIGRSALCNLKHRHDDHWVGLHALKHSQGVIGFDFLYGDFEKEYPFDKERFDYPNHCLIAVATNLASGKPEYFDSSKTDFETFKQAVRASASMPFVSKPVKINDNYYLDGGCATKLPLRYATSLGYDKTVFVTTRESSYRRKEKTEESLILKKMYAKYPEFRKAYVNAAKVYNEDCDLADSLVKEGKIFRISPSSPVTVSRLEGDMEKLGELYYLGYHDAEAQFDNLMKYLNK